MGNSNSNLDDKSNFPTQSHESSAFGDEEKHQTQDESKFQESHKPNEKTEAKVLDVDVPFYHMVRHFQRLFQISRIDFVVAKMNQLYIQQIHYSQIDTTLSALKNYLERGTSYFFFYCFFFLFFLKKNQNIRFQSVNVRKIVK